MGSIDQNNSYIFPLNASDSFEGIYSSTTNFSEILISVETDTQFTLTIEYSSNSVDVGITKTYTETVPSTNAFLYQLKPALRYFRVVLTNSDTNNQSYLRLETILKSTVVYQEGGNAPATNVNIQSPLNGSGYVEVVDMNNHYDGDGNLLVAGSLSLSGTIDSNIVAPLVNGNVAISLENINSNYLADGALITSDTLTHLFLSNISSNVSSTNTTVGNIYNVLNTRGSSIFIDGTINAGDNTSSIDLHNTPIKLLSIYGNSTDATDLTVLFSNDNTAFYQSQYKISVLGDYGFSIASNPAYIALTSSNTVATLTAFLNYS